MSRDFVVQLERSGFFDYLDTTTVTKTKNQIAQKGWVGIFGETGRLFPADAEELAEGGVGSFLREIQPFLHKQGVRLSQVKDELLEDYVVYVNGKRYTIWTNIEAEEEISGGMKGLTWGLSAARTLHIINTLLYEAGSREQAYAVNGGNDLFVFFLTKEQWGAIQKHPDATPPDTPYMAREEYPWFGQEH